MDFYIILSLVYVLVSCDGDLRVNLTAVVGRSVTFPDPVKEKGYFLIGGKHIAGVSKGDFEIDEDIYRNRLRWSNRTGLFTLSDLQKHDSGVYSIDSKKGMVFFNFYDLKVFEEVSVPVVSCVNVSSASITLQCSVKPTEQTTLSWFRGDQSVVRSSSAVLPLTVQQGNYTHQYKCVSQNPEEEKTLTVNIKSVCGLNDTQLGDGSGSKSEIKYIIIIITVIIVIIVIAIIGVILYIVKRKFSKPKSPTLQSEDSLQYAQIDHLKRRDPQSPNSSTPSGNISQPPMDTVYDLILPH